MSTEVVDVHHLDAHAEEYFEAERREPLAGWAAQVADTDFRGRPRARLVAALVLADRDPTDRQAEVEARAALRSLQRAKDASGVSLAYAVLGRLAEARGDLSAAADSFRRAGPGTPAAVSPVGLVRLGLQAWNANAMDAAKSFGEVTVGLSRERRSRADEAQAVALLGTLASHEGRFADAERLAREALADIGDAPETAVLHSLLGSIAVRRGLDDEAARHLDRSLELAPANRDLEAQVVVPAVWAEFRPGVDAEVRLRRAWSASAMAAGAETWARHTALRAVAAAACAAGDQEASTSAIETLLAESTGYERGRALLLRAECRVPLSEHERIDSVEEAYDELLEAGARYYAAVAAVRRSELAAEAGDGEVADRWRDRAVELSTGDLAFLRLLESGHRLEIDISDVPSVSVDGAPVTFLTRHAELTLYLLVVGGSNGVDAETLARRLWPGAQQRRWRPRLRTCLWQVRKAIDPEGWRLRRRGTRVYFDAADLAVDTEALAAAAERFEL